MDALTCEVQFLEGVRELQASQGDLKGDVLSELRWIMLGLKVEGCPSCLD